VILAVGASLTKGSILTASIPASATLIHATNDPRDIAKSYVVDVGLVGDAALVLAQLVRAVRERAHSGPKRSIEAVAHELEIAKSAWLESWQPRLYSDRMPLDSYRVINDFMSEVDPAEAIVTHDSGSPRDQLMPFYVSTTPHGYIGWGKSHALGTGLGLALGAKAAFPEKLCVHFMGDAAFGMTGLDLETAVRCNLPTLSVVFNNGAMAVEMNSLARSHQLFGTRALGGDYTAVARALGLSAERVDRPENVRPALRRARETTREGRASLIEFMTADELAFSNFFELGR
jgi:acetolactate synthase-1/2/3 large subunit